MMELKATIDKADITPLHKLDGLANDAPLTVGGRSRATGTIVFRGFRGAIDMATKRYVGTFRFEECDDTVKRADLTRVATLLDQGKAGKGATAKSPRS